MKRIAAVALLLLATVLHMILPASAAKASPCFEDVQRGQWYYSAVRSAYEQGWMSGLSDTEFGVETPLTRGELVISLGKLAGINLRSYSAGDNPVFRDVDEALLPYVLWAKETGISQGVSGTRFAPEAEVTHEQLAAMVGRFVEVQELTLPEISLTPRFSDADEVSDWARESFELLRHGGILQFNGSGNFYPSLPATRAEAAAILVRVSKLIYGDDSPVVREWTDYIPVSVDSVPETEDPILTPQALVDAAEAYEIQGGSNAWTALCRINTEYAALISAQDRESPLVFLFEGAGNSSDPAQRRNAMCVVIRDGEVVYLNQNSTTIPDDPFDPRKNDGADMPTLCSGIYDYESVNQYSATGTHAALNVLDAQVVRFHNEAICYASTSEDINIHRRAKNTVATRSDLWASSYGCCLIGLAGSSAGDEYMGFIQSVGLIPAGSTSQTAYRTFLTGKVVVDRSLAETYLKRVGYSDEGVALIG